jgi:hypothetical protein
LQKPASGAGARFAHRWRGRRANRGGPVGAGCFKSTVARAGVGRLRRSVSNPEATGASDRLTPHSPTRTQCSAGMPPSWRLSDLSARIRFATRVPRTYTIPRDRSIPWQSNQLRRQRTQGTRIQADEQRLVDAEFLGTLRWRREQSFRE